MNTTSDAKGINILMADDDSDDRLFFSTALNEMFIDSNLAMVSDGVELMEYLDKTTDNLPDIMFLDLNMPRKSGMETLKEIRSNRNFDTTCVVIYSTYTSEEQVDELLSQGANIYFKKPSELEKIKDMIRQVIRIYRYYPDLGTNEDALFMSV